MRLLLIYFDGLGDRPAPELGGRTPLEAASTPNLDRFARESITGLIHPKSPGYALGSPLALHLMFGFPEALFPDRGPLLATARGIEIAPGDVVLAARFASVVPEDDGTLRLKERFIRGEDNACAALATEIADTTIDGFRFRYVYSGRGDGLLVISGGASFEVTDTDPLGLDLPVIQAQARAGAREPGRAERTAAALNAWLRWAYRQLEAAGDGARAGLPANFVITKWSGPKPAYPTFRETWGMVPASLPDEEVVSGLMLELGFRVEQIAGSTPETDLRVRLRTARDLLGDGYEFIHLHSKYPDPMSHQNQPGECVTAIEALDRAMADYWEQLAGLEDLVTVLTTDHTTPSVWAEHPRGVFSDQHGGEEGPIAIRGGNVRVDHVSEYGERAMALGGLGHLRGEDMMPVLLDAAQRTNMYEMRPQRVHRPYRPRPEDVQPFCLDR